MKSRKSEKRKESATLRGIIRASLRYRPVSRIRLVTVHRLVFTTKCTVTNTIRPPVSIHDFGDVSSCEVWRLQRGPGAVAGATGASVAIWGAGRQLRPYSYHRYYCSIVLYSVAC